MGTPGVGFGVSRSRASRSAPSRIPARLPRSAPRPGASASRGGGLGTSGDTAWGQLSVPLGRMGTPLFGGLGLGFRLAGVCPSQRCQARMGDVLFLVFVSPLGSLPRGGDNLGVHRGWLGYGVGGQGEQGGAGVYREGPRDGGVPMRKGSQGQGTSQGQRASREKGDPATHRDPGDIGVTPQPFPSPLPRFSSTPRLGNFWDEITRFWQFRELGQGHG